jgi:hypothetical protein
MVEQCLITVIEFAHSFIEDKWKAEGLATNKEFCRGQVNESGEIVYLNSTSERLRETFVCETVLFIFFPEQVIVLFAVACVNGTHTTLVFTVFSLPQLLNLSGRV